MFEQSFKNIDATLRKDSGVSSELDYVEQTSWILFLKYLEDLEQDKANAAILSGEEYNRLIESEYQWSTWAAPKQSDGSFDHNAITGDDLLDFVNLKLFPYLKQFKTRASSPDTIEYKIGEIFSELRNKIQSGYVLRDIIQLIDEMRFRTHADQLEMSHLYEDKIKNMGNAGRNGGEYYTPRPLIKTIVKVVNPQIGQTVYDGAVGSAGFLVEAFDHMRSQGNLSTQDIETLQKRTFYGKEKKSLAYIIGIMNMILHGVEAPNIIHTNTLAENTADIQEKDRHDIILANPPFGGSERPEVKENFPIKIGETASLFMQHFMKIMKAGGQAAIIIKNTFLSNGEAGSADAAIRKELLENFNLHTILDLPAKTFTTAGVKTVVLFFNKGEATKNIWYYKLNLQRSLGKTNPLNENDLAEFLELQKIKAESENSWNLSIADVDNGSFDLSVVNPNEPEKPQLRSVEDILSELVDLNEKTHSIIRQIQDNCLKG